MALRAATTTAPIRRARSAARTRASTAGPECASVERLSYWYPGGRQSALNDVSLAIGAGLSLVASGSGGGKSTLLRLLDGLVPQFHGGRIAGRASVLGLDPIRTPIHQLARRVGLVFQDAETQSVYGSVEREIAFGLENLGLPRPEMLGRVDAALAELGIEGLRGRRLATLSGGERQRVQLAAVLALQPDLLALDEPTSQLDGQGAAAVLGACLRLAAAGRSLVVAEHRLEALLPAADRLIVIEDGRLIGAGRPAELAARLSSPPPVVELGQLLDWRPLPLTVEAARRRRRPALQAGPMPFSGQSAARSAPRELAWELRSAALSAAPRGAPAILDVSLAGGRGEVSVIMGANGSGKTTLLRALAGLAEPIAGSVVQAPGRTAYLPQNPAALLHLPTVRAEVELTLRRAGSPESADLMLAAFGLLPLAETYPRDLSAGQRQRAALAAILAGGPTLALLDEPTRGMDLAARRALCRVVRALAERGSAVVLATHDVDLAAEVADRVILLRDGRAVDLGPPERALAAGTPLATQIGRLYPDGPVSVPGLLRVLGAAGAAGSGAARAAGAAGSGAADRTAGSTEGLAR